MENSTTDHSAYCKELIKKLDYGRYLQCAFLPASERERAVALFSLNAELIHARSAVSEEMLGHIRYAWWQETIEKLDKKHPVIEALIQAALPREQLLKLVVAYREAYPELPPQLDELLDQIAHDIFPEERFEKAGRIIRQHQGGKLTLLVKLLFV